MIHYFQPKTTLSIEQVTNDMLVVVTLKGQRYICVQHVTGNYDIVNLTTQTIYTHSYAHKKEFAAWGLGAGGDVRVMGTLYDTEGRQVIDTPVHMVMPGAYVCHKVYGKNILYVMVHTRDGYVAMNMKNMAVCGHTYTTVEEYIDHYLSCGCAVYSVDNLTEAM